MNELHLIDGKMTKNKISAIINGERCSPFLARKIEIALELPKHSLVELVGFPTSEYEKKKLEDIG
jgi:hypothetical protein